MSKKTQVNEQPVEGEPAQEKVVLNEMIDRVMERLREALANYATLPEGGQYPDSRCIRVYLPMEESDPPAYFTISLTREPDDKTSIVITSSDGSDVHSALVEKLVSIYG